MGSSLSILLHHAVFVFGELTRERTLHSSATGEADTLHAAINLAETRAFEVLKDKVAAQGLRVEPTPTHFSRPSVRILSSKLLSHVIDDNFPHLDILSSFPL